MGRDPGDGIFSKLSPEEVEAIKNEEFRRKHPKLAASFDDIEARAAAFSATPEGRKGGEEFRRAFYPPDKPEPA